MPDKTWNWPQFTLAVVALLALATVTVVEQLGYGVADAGSKQILIGFATLAFAFFFQSSVGSKAKDSVIATQAAAAAAVGLPDIRITTAAMESGPNTPLAAVLMPKAGSDVAIVPDPSTKPATRPNPGGSSP